MPGILDLLTNDSRWLPRSAPDLEASAVAPYSMMSQMAPAGIPWQSWQGSSNVEDRRIPESLVPFLMAYRRLTTSPDAGVAPNQNIPDFYPGAAPRGALSQQLGANSVEQARAYDEMMANRNALPITARDWFGQLYRPGNFPQAAMSYPYFAPGR